MDSDEEVRSERRLALEEMSKLRCNSASPSTLSTASSGSPLVRNGGGSGKRPAPTSIAAAQLQCQQQRLEFSNRLAQHGNLANKINDTLATNANKRADQVKSAKKLPASTTDNNKSLGYKVGKSMAFRAYRFNEFWSVNKLRYMNLACLLMTLICLAAILLLAGNNGAKPPAASTLNNPRRSPVTDDLAEGLQGSSQPLVSSSSGSKQDYGEHIEKDYGERDLEAVDTRAEASKPRDSKFRRKISTDLGVSSELAKGEREVEETTTTTQQPNELELGNKLESLVDPIMSQLFDMEFGSLYNLLRQRANSSRPLIRHSKNGATIIISSSNSNSNSNSNDTSLGNSSDTSPLPTLLERLLPPMLRPMGFKSSGDAVNNASNMAATATITIGAEPMFSSSSPLATIRMSTSGLGSSGPFSPLEALFGPPMLPPPPPPLPFMSRQRRLFMEPVSGLSGARFAMGSPFGGASLWGPPPPPPGLLGMMMMRAQQDQQDQQEDFNQAPLRSFVGSNPFELAPSSHVAKEPAGSGSNKTQDNNNQSTSQQQQSNSTTASKSTGSGQQEQQQQDGSEDQFEVVAPTATSPSSRRLQSLYSRSRLSSPNGAGSMLIFSSGPMDPSELPPFAGPFAGLLPPPVGGLSGPQMMLVGGGEGNRAGDGLMSPLIKSLLSNVISDLMPHNSAELVPTGNAGSANKSSSTSANGAADKQAKASSRATAWMSPSSPTSSPSSSSSSSDPDDDWAPLSSNDSGTWDEKEQQGKQLRARHRSQELGDELDDGPAASFLAGLQLEQLGSSSSANPESGQPITTRHFRPIPARVEMVPAGLKSQSLSRADEQDEPVGLSRHLGRPHGRIAAAFLRPPPPQNDRRLDDDSTMGSFSGPDLPPFGFIGKLLSDLSTSPNQRHEHRHTSSNSRSRSLDLDDLDEGDSSQSEQSQEPASALLRPLRLASARIRMMRPTIINHAGEPTPFLPAHFSVSSGDPSGEEKESVREEQASNRLDENSLNSAEDRIRLTLNQIYQHSPEPQQQQQQQQLKAFVLGPIPRGATIPIPLVQQQQQVKKSEPAKDGNPFTSPSSPLFGFPANSQPTTMTPPSTPANEPQKAAAKLVVTTTVAAAAAAAPTAAQNQPGASRQQRSFTYHSNNELAAPFVSQQKQQATNHQQAESRARSRFVAPLASPPLPSFMAPTAGIMGRRLDDFNEAYNHHPHSRHQHGNY